MKQISGYVLVKETNSGVPNLVVTVYDSDESIKEIREHYNERDFSLKDFGKRVGSVLTDQNGKFILTNEDLEFPGNDPRIDLLLIVFAPEDIQSVEIPFPLPPANRILYVSTVPRPDAGAVEAFVIRLLQAQLDKFNISAVNSTLDTEINSHRYANVIQSTWDFRDNVREQLKSRMQEELKRSQAIKNLAQKKVEEFSAIPLQLRDNNLRNNDFLIIGKSNLKDNLKKLQNEVILDGYKRMESYQPTLHLDLTIGDLEDLGLEVEGSEIVGEISSDKLTEKVNSLIKGFDLVRLRGINNLSPEELERKYLINSPILNPNEAKQ